MSESRFAVSIDDAPREVVDRQRPDAHRAACAAAQQLRRDRAGHSSRRDDRLFAAPRVEPDGQFGSDFAIPGEREEGVGHAVSYSALYVSVCAAEPQIWMVICNIFSLP